MRSLLKRFTRRKGVHSRGTASRLLVNFDLLGSGSGSEQASKRAVEVDFHCQDGGRIELFRVQIEGLECQQLDEFLASEFACPASSSEGVCVTMGERRDLRFWVSVGWVLELAGPRLLLSCVTVMFIRSLGLGLCGFTC